MIEIGLIDIIIPLSSILAIGLAVLVDDPKIKRFSPVIGLLGQPFWIWETFFAQTWGIFVLSVIYLFIWIAGVYKYWWKK